MDRYPDNPVCEARFLASKMPLDVTPLLSGSLGEGIYRFRSATPGHAFRPENTDKTPEFDDFPEGLRNLPF